MQYVAVLFLILLVSMQSRAGTDEAVALYGRQDYASAYTEFMRMAEIGDHQAQFNIGAMYYHGQHVPQDSIQAYAWMALAGQKSQGNWNELAGKILASLSDEQKQQAAQARQSLLEKFADDVVTRQLAPEIGGGADAASWRVRKRVIPVYPKARGRLVPGWVEVLFTIAADGTTRNHIVTSASDAMFVQPTLEAIKAWQFEPARVNGKAIEVYGLEQAFSYQPEGVRFNEKKVRELVAAGLQKAETGDAAERYRYAHFLEILPNYTNVHRESSDQNRWYWQSAQEGYGPAQFSLAKNLLYGRACTADTAKSLNWLERSAEAGQPDSQYLLGTEMLSGARLARNPESAVKWLQRAAQSDLRHAQLKLAWLHATSVDANWRNAALAREYIDKIDDKYIDHLSLFEARAAVAAAEGDFKEAVKWQKESLAEAKRYELPLDGVNAKLAYYQAGKAWIERS